VGSFDTARVLMVEDHAATAAAMALLLDSAGFHRVLSVGTLAAARESLRVGQFDCILLDIHLPDGDGTSLVEELRTASSKVPILIITGLTSQDRVLGALRAGADGFLYKDDLDYRLCRALHDVLTGGAPLSSAAAKVVISALRGTGTSGTRPTVTDRQTEVLALLATGAGYAEIARELKISVNTVRSHVVALYQQLGVENRAEAVNLAWHWGLLEHSH
jgi:DNA-binding NarL/FixJ family response regulator